MKKNETVLTIAVFALLLVGCGGGSGGSSSSDSSGQASSSGTGIRVLHAAIDAPPVAVTATDSGSVLQTTWFAQAVGYVAPAAGVEAFTVTTAGNSPVSLAIDVSGSDKGKRSILFAETGDLEYRVTALDDTAPALSSGSAALRVVNGVKGSNQLDVTVNGSTLNGALSITDASLYSEVPGGAVTVTASDDGQVLYSGSVSLSAGSAYTLLLTGESGYVVSGRLYND